MNYHHSRQMLILDESSRKRKDGDTFYSSPKSSNSLTAVNNAVTTSFQKPDPKKKCEMPNPILAGYMAYEYLSKGTLLGQKFDPARPRAAPVAEPKKRKLSPEEVDGKSKLKPNPKNQNYVEIASLLRSDGTHISDIVNPTQLAQWIQM